MSSPNVVFVCEEVECSILNKYHLFQNGRALLKCRIFLPPTTGNPDVENSRSHAPRYDTYVPIVNRHIKTVLIFFVPVFLLRSGFVLSVLLLSSTPATVSPFRRELLLIFVFFIAKIRQVLTSLISPFASFRACCVVVEFHSSHSFANFAVFYSSFS